MKRWKEEPLSVAAELVRGVTFKPDDVVELGTPNTVVCLRTKNVQEELDLSDVWAIDQSLVRRPEQHLLDGDILVSSANSWNLVGKCCWVSGLPWRATFGGFVSVLRARPTVMIPRFLFWWFSSGPVQAQVRGFGRKTTNISNLNVDRCLAMKIPCPPLEEQRRLVEILERVEALRQDHRAALGLVEELMASLQARGYAGLL